MVDKSGGEKDADGKKAIRVANLRTGKDKGTLPVKIQDRINKLDELFAEMGFDPAGSLAALANSLLEERDNLKVGYYLLLARHDEAVRAGNPSTAIADSIGHTLARLDAVTSRAESILFKLMKYSYYEQQAPVAPPQEGGGTGSITVTLN